jgi:DnaK suppressor protein
VPRASRAVDAAKQLGNKARSRKPASPTRKAGPARPSVKKSTTSAARRSAQPAKKAAKATKKSRSRAPGAATRTTRVTTKVTKARGRATKEQSADKFLAGQRAALEAERASYIAQAEALKAEADQMAQEAEPGDVQFDDESGEGGTVNIDRERDLALSAQARAAVEEIDHALAKIAEKRYGTCERCGQPIPRARLKALPQARLCVACKSGGLSQR